MASCGKDVGFSTCFLWPREVGLHPLKTKALLRYPQRKFFWSFRDYVLLLRQTLLMLSPQPTTTAYPPLGATQSSKNKKHCHMFRASGSGSAIVSIIAFGRIHIQDINRGGNLGVFCFYSKPIAGEIIIWAELGV